MPQAKYEVMDVQPTEIAVRITFPDGDTLDLTLPMSEFEGMKDKEAKGKLKGMLKKRAKEHKMPDGVPNFPDGEDSISYGESPNSFQ